MEKLFGCYSSLWKRVIAWERSHAASGYGIIWGDADRNKQGRIQCGMSQRGLQWWQEGFNRTTDSNKIEGIVLGDQKSRELKRIRTTGLAVYLYGCTILHTRECGHGEMRNKQFRRNRRSDITEGWRVLQSLISPSKGNEKRSYYHTGYSFLVTHPGTNPAKQEQRGLQW